MFNLSSQLQELRSTLVGLVLLLAATIIGFVWLGIGLYHWLNASLGPAWGALVLGLIYFIPLILYALSKTFVSAPALPATLSSEPLEVSTLKLAKLFESLSGRSPFLTASAVLVAVFLANRFPGLLRLLLQVLSAYIEDASFKSASAQDADSPKN
jgi:hypothetical protein